MSSAQGLKFYITSEHPCSYLPGKTAMTLFADPDISMNDMIYSDLSHLGFRRSGNHLYRPTCRTCDLCKAVRVPTHSFKPTKSQQRVWKRNQDLSVSLQPATFREDYYQLYEAYIRARHADGDMYPPSREQFKSFLLSSWSNTQFIEFRDNEQLVAVAVSDLNNNARSAVYTLYAPHQSARSLGTYAILWQIAQAREERGEWLNLGYWIKGCEKMTYKIRYRPLEILMEGRWVLVN